MRRPGMQGFDFIKQIENLHQDRPVQIFHVENGSDLDVTL